MKKVLFGLLCAALMWGCGSGSRYTVTIAASEGVDDVRIVIPDEEGLPDLTEVEFDESTNTYKAKGRIDEPSVAMLVDGDGRPLAMLFVEKGDILVEYDGETDEYVVSGTPSNDARNLYTAELTAFADEWAENPVHTPEEQEAFLEQFYDKVLEIVDLNNDNLYGVSLFATSGAMILEPEEILERIEKFPARLRKSVLLEPVRAYAEAVLNASVGAHYTEIVAPDTEDVEIPLSSVVGEGKWVLVDFWATWCPPCRAELPYLKAAYKQYADKGFEIYGVSVDNDAEGWKTFVAENGMNWINVIDVRGDKSSPAADAYDVQTIPTNFLISPEGEIVAKNLRGEDVEAALSEIFE